MTVHHMVLKNPAKEKNRQRITIFLDCAVLEEIISDEITVVIVVAEGHMRNVKAWKRYNCRASKKVFSVEHFSKKPAFFTSMRLSERIFKFMMVISRGKNNFLVTVQ